MIELPEAHVIAEQMSEQLRDKRVASCVRGNVAHKFAFYSGTAEEYAQVFPGKVLGAARGHGNAILVPLQPGYTLGLGGGGERILYHESARTLPKKHHLLLNFEDGTVLTVTVQGWGNVLLLDPKGLEQHPHAGHGRVSALSEDYTFEFFDWQFGELDEGDSKSVKFFLISEPGVWGMGNGYLQDVLFRARLHPRRRAVGLSGQERVHLYESIREILARAVELGGRDTERDLYNQRGGYVRVMDSKTLGKPCPACATAIEKIQYLGGACYFCPNCQPI